MKFSEYKARAVGAMASGGVTFLLPVIAFAQIERPANTSTFFDVINVLQVFITAVTPFVIGLAVLVILWGVFGYIAGAGDEEKRAESRKYIIWGIIGLFVMVSIWGLVGIVSKTFNLREASFLPPATAVCPAAGQVAVYDPILKQVRCRPGPTQ